MLLGSASQNLSTWTEADGKSAATSLPSELSSLSGPRAASKPFSPSRSKAVVGQEEELPTMHTTGRKVRLPLGKQAGGG